MPPAWRQIRMFFGCLRISHIAHCSNPNQILGTATKDNFENALCSHNESKDETVSDQRGAIAAQQLHHILQHAQDKKFGALKHCSI